MQYKYSYGDKNQDKITYKSLLFYLNFLFGLEKEDFLSYVNYLFDINQISKKNYEDTIIIITKIITILKNKSEDNIDVNINDNINFSEIIYNKEITGFFYTLYSLQIRSINILDISQYKMLLGNKKIIIGNESIIIEEDLAKTNIEKKISYILGKNIFKDYIDNGQEDGNIKKKFTFNEYIEKKQSDNKYDYEKEIGEIVKRLKDIYETNKVTDYISSLLLYGKVDEGKYKSILFYDLETLISNQEIVSGTFLGINFNKKNQPELFLILMYNDIAEIKNYNMIFKNIFEKIKSKLEYKLRKLVGDKKIGLYLMEKKKFIELYNTRIKENKDIPILSGFNITGFDNVVLFKDNPELIELSNKCSIDIFEFLSDIKDKGELNLVAKNNGFGTKLMTHEELFGYLKSDFLNDPKNFDGIAKMILYNIVDTLLTFDLTNGYINNIRKKQNIRGATKMIDYNRFKEYIGKKIIK